MKLRSAVRRPAVIAAVTVGAVALGFGGTAAADAFITGDDVKNGSLTGADIETNSVTWSDIANGTVRSTEIRNGSIEAKDLSNNAIGEIQDGTLVSSAWGDILRNTLGSAGTELRYGPFAGANIEVHPPMGAGSLQIDVAGGTSKIAFGNEVDFAGKPVSALGAPSFFVYQTGENNGIGAGNLPNITIELNPDVAGKTYTSLVFVPTKAATSNGWTEYSATDGYWYFTNGTVATTTNCGQADACTLAQAKAGLGADAKLYSVGVGKGRDAEWHGAVDALTVGDTTFDFEPRGVFEVDAQ